MVFNSNFFFHQLNSIHDAIPQDAPLIWQVLKHPYTYLLRKQEAPSFGFSLYSSGVSPNFTSVRRTSWNLSERSKDDRFSISLRSLVAWSIVITNRWVRRLYRCNILTHLLDQSTSSLDHPLVLISSKSYPLQALADPRQLFLRKRSVALKSLVS